MCLKQYLRSLGSAAVLALLSGCVSVLDLDDALAVTPYHIENSGRIVVNAHVNGQGPFKFALDTAATISAFFDKLRYELALETHPSKTVIIHGATASGEFSLLDVDQLVIGSEVWSNPKVVSLPEQTSASVSIDGILGVDFLKRYAVGFTTSDRVIRLYPPDLIAARAYLGWSSVPLKLRPIGESGAALYFIDIEIDGKKIPAAFDLGAGLNLINWPGAHSVDVSPVGLHKDKSFSGALDDWPIIARLETEEVTTANVRWRKENFLIADIEIFQTFMLSDSPAAILGAGLFTQRDFIIDFVRNRLLVKTAMDEVNVSDNTSTTSQIDKH